MQIPGSPVIWGCFDQKLGRFVQNWGRFGLGTF